MGAGPLSSIPLDVLSHITHFLSLESITKLSQVCRTLSDCILEDKRLWVQCLRRDVIAKGIEIPAYRPSLGIASAADVHSWVKTAISLQRAYATGGQRANVHSFAVDEELETTWVKIVRGHWCLVAMSNITQSFVGIWKTQSNGSMELENRFYLPGPVIDGDVDDCTEEIRIAITVATTDPYIQILSLGMKGDETCLTPLECLLGARHVLLLKDSVVGYATLQGNDTFPHLTDWRTGATILLCPALYNNRADMLFGDIHSIWDLAQPRLCRYELFRRNLYFAVARISPAQSILSFWVPVVIFPDDSGYLRQWLDRRSVSQRDPTISA